jgi:hypothetical protein
MHGGSPGEAGRQDSAGHPATPPRFAERFLAFILPPAHREEQLGDLCEGFRKRSASPEAARRWYWGQVIRSIWPSIRVRARSLRPDLGGSRLSFGSFGQDLRHGIRSLWKTPSFTVVAALTLGIAIGVTTAVFSLVSVIIFADLPMQQDEEVALIQTRNPALNVEQGTLSLPDYMDLVEGTTYFESLSALAHTQWAMSGVDAPTDVSGVLISAGLAESWRLPAVVGRTFSAEESDVGAPEVAMLAHGFWTSRFGARADVVGESIRLDGVEHTVIGVMDPRFGSGSLSFAGTEVLVPLELDRERTDRESRSLFVTGRIASDDSLGPLTSTREPVGTRLDGPSRGLLHYPAADLHSTVQLPAHQAQHYRGIALTEDPLARGIEVRAIERGRPFRRRNADMIDKRRQVDDHLVERDARRPVLGQLPHDERQSR